VGVDFGDGPRHPTQLYEMLFLIALALVLARSARYQIPEGRLWRLFVIGYFGWRFVVEFLKPRYTWPVLHLSAIQTASGIAVIIGLWQAAGFGNKPYEANIMPDDDWLNTWRTEAWAGEIRVNLVRIAALIVFMRGI